MTPETYKTAACTECTFKTEVDEQLSPRMDEHSRTTGHLSFSRITVDFSFAEGLDEDERKRIFEDLVRRAGLPMKCADCDFESPPGRAGEHARDTGHTFYKASKQRLTQ